MGLFNIFGDNEHRVFNYKPIYYNKEEEERKKRFAAVDGSLEKAKEKGEYVPGASIKGSMCSGNYQRTRGHNSKAQTIIGIVSLIMVMAVLFYIAKFYSLL